MNEIERAIKLIEYDEVMTCDCPKCEQDRWAFKLALVALREKAERGKGCERCEDGYYFDPEYGEMDGYVFCPMCGKRLEVKQDV